MALNRQAVLAAIVACAPEDEISQARGRKVFEAKGSLEEVLDASAPDTEPWLIGEAAYNAVVEVLDGIPPLHRRLRPTRRVRPYDGRVSTTVASALHCALDAAAPDQESWLRGEEAYFNTLPATGATEDDYDRALDAALDAAAPDQFTWIRGDRVFIAVRNTLADRTFSSRARRIRHVRVFTDEQFAPRQRQQA
jgi:hypothetical protein